jgi:nitrous oxidase accessory protein NosD
VHDNVMKATDVSIFVQDTSTGNSIHDNDFAGPADPDCRDDSLGGTGDFGTDNFWEDNLGSGSPAGICTEP